MTFLMKQVQQQYFIFAAIIWKGTMENSTSIVNTTYVNDDDGISATLFNFLVFFLPIPAIASLMLCCCFIGIARSNKPLSAQSSCRYDNGIIKVSDLTKTRDLKQRTGCICDRLLWWFRCFSHLPSSLTI